ncbi:MAG: O-antigen ligase family protein [Phycisphaerae bacterium]
MGGFGDWYGQTTVHPLGLAVLTLLAAALFAVRRQHAIIPFLILMCLIPAAQRIVVASLDFTFYRLLIMAGIARVFAKGEHRSFRWNTLDTMVVAWVASGIVVMTAEYGTVTALINRLGWALDQAGAYLVFRCLVRDREDLHTLVRAVVILAVPVAAFLAFEWATQRNIFSIFGGVPAKTMIRDGRLRCQGPFSHPIMAGCFWASLLPLVLVFWHNHTSRRFVAALGTAAVLLIVAACASSTPLLTVGAGLLAYGFYFFRRHTRGARWAILFMLIGLHFAMAKPVWHLMARVNIVGGSTGWHRYYIFDTFIRHFDDWWLLGESDVLSWGVWQMRDITNQYVLEGLRGGLLSLTFFVASIVFAFIYAGRALRRVSNPRDRRIIWALGAWVLTHALTFFGISYAGQISLLWVLALACLGSAVTMRFESTAPARPAARASHPTRSPPALRPWPHTSG